MTHRFGTPISLARNSHMVPYKLQGRNGTSKEKMKGLVSLTVSATRMWRFSQIRIMLFPSLVMTSYLRPHLLPPDHSVAFLPLLIV